MPEDGKDLRSASIASLLAGDERAFMKPIYPLSIFAVLTLAGCAGTQTDPSAAHNHPANAHAETSPLPALDAELLNLTNTVAAKPPAARAGPEHQHDHKQ
jgi:hypothetical protein